MEWRVASERFARASSAPPTTDTAGRVARIPSGVIVPPIVIVAPRITRRGYAGDTTGLVDNQGCFPIGIALRVVSLPVPRRAHTVVDTWMVDRHIQVPVQVKVASNSARADVDRKITDARIELDKLRSLTQGLHLNVGDGAKKSRSRVDGVIHHRPR